MPKRPTALRVVDLGDPMPVGKPEPEGGSWREANSEPQARRARKGLSVLQQFGTTSMFTTEAGFPSNRLLTNDQLWQLYLSTPDVRAAVDGICRRISTWDWLVEPTLDPSASGYEQAQDEAEEARRFLAAPSVDLTWQETLDAWCRDLLVFDAAALEPVPTRGARVGIAGSRRLAELINLRGADIVPATDGHGRITGYHQVLGGLFAQQGLSNKAPAFKPSELIYTRLFTNTTAWPFGLPLIETIVNEAIAMLLASDHAVKALDADEIPPGLLVLGGVGKAAADRAKADLARLRGQPNKIRVIDSPDPKALSVEWVELRRSMRELQLADVVDQIRRTIWRVFGVQPVEMGAVADVNRSTAHAQLDVSSSHLITPILELAQAKVNARVVPLLVDADLASAVRFTFDYDARLDPGEREQRSRSHGEYLDRAVLTINEVRAELGFPPVDGGDVPRLQQGGLWVPLVPDEAPQAPEPTTDPDDDDDGPSEPPASPSGGGGGVTDPDAATPDEGEDGPGEVSQDDRRVTWRVAAGGLTLGLTLDLDRPSTATNLGALAEWLADQAELQARAEGLGTLADDLPSDWQPDGRFKDVRTLDLGRLAGAVAAYQRGVAPLYRQALREVLAVVRAEYDPDSYTGEDAARLIGRVGAVFDRLAAQWQATTDPLYVRASRVGRDAAADFTGLPVVEDWRERGEVYGARAHGYLVEPDGLLGTLRTRTAAILGAVARGRSAPCRPTPELRAEWKIPPELEAGIEAELVLDAVEAQWAANAHRTSNWGGRLVELSNSVFMEGMDEGSALAGQPGAVEWWGEWVSVGDRNMCRDCSLEGQQGHRPLASFTLTPGGDTQCGARCRCVIVVWTKAEVQAGDAPLLSGGLFGVNEPL